jgi:glucose/arabinose dehydrogenase
MVQPLQLKSRITRYLVVISILSAAFPSAARQQQPNALKLVPHVIKLANGITFSLNLPEEFRIDAAAGGLKRLRFMAKAPDGSIFVTSMYSRADNTRGAVYNMEGLDEKGGYFEMAVPYLKNLRNPNSLAFYIDPKGRKWLYLALTDKLVRYKFGDEDEAPQGEPEVLATYPDYGLNYKYGGWHLTRTIVFGQGEDRDKLYVSVGSSCNACEEKEEIRATLSVMDADGKNPKVLGHGLRNAVGMRMVDGTLYLTNMGADHLGDNAPDDTMFALDKKELHEDRTLDFGWPYCYFDHGKILPDPQFNESPNKSDCGKVPKAFATFAAHASPLGLEYFGSDSNDPLLRNHFLVALHGSGHKRLKRGYRVVRISDKGTIEDFITGFLHDGVIYGRPCDIFRMGPDSFLLTDDFAGVIYYIHKK